MSDGTEQKGLVDTSVLWSGGSDWLLTEQGSPENKTETNPDTGEVVYKKIRALTLEEELFVREYCKSYNANTCAKSLSITPARARGFISRKPVQAAIRKRALAMAKSADMDQMWVLQGIREVVERCMGDADDPNSKFDASNALRGLELVGKTMAMFVDKSETNVNNKTIIRIESNVPRITNGPISIEHEVVDG